jgi:multiple sugar transport system ATP-binding protein
MAEVEVREIRKSFGGGNPAVDGISLTCKNGEYLVLLGPSGCGKTTLLRMIAGLEAPTGGDVLIGGKSVRALPPRARKIAMVFQSYALYPHKKVSQNISFPLEAQGMGADERMEKVKWAAGLLGIDHLLQRKPRQLSGGERQRVALARALVREPQVFLLDEPLSNLDAKLRASARLELKQFQQRVGVSTIYVTHDQVEAMGLGDRIAVLSQGRLQQVGTPEEIYHHPANTFVATFVGSPPMNLLERDGKLIGFRPENIRLEKNAGSQDDATVFRGHVLRVENLGSDRYVYLRVKDAHGDANVIAKFAIAEPLEVSNDEDADLVIRNRHVNFFDRDSGQKAAA